MFVRVSWFALLSLITISVQQLSVSYQAPTLIKSDRIAITIYNAGLAINSTQTTVTFLAPMGDSVYQVLHCIAGTTSRLRNSNFYIEVISRAAVGLVINLTHHGIVAGSTNTFTIPLLVVDSSLSNKVFITNCISISSSANVPVSLTWPVTSSNPVVLAFIQSVSCSSGAAYSIASSLSTASTATITVGTWSNVSSLRAGLLVIDGWVDSSCAIISRAIVSTFATVSTTTNPTVNSSLWFVGTMGLQLYSPSSSDFTWSCFINYSYCSGLLGNASVTVVYFTNLTCPNNSALSAQSISTGVCNCLTGYYFNSSGSGGSCWACHQSCYDCTSSGASKCSSCSILTFRFLSGSSCLCSTGYFHNGTAVCAQCKYSCLSCTNSLTCTACNSSTHRQSSSTQCVCTSGFYDAGISVCQACSYRCASCSIATACTSCRTGCNRNISDSAICPCLTGYYDAGVAICALCSYNCLTCDASTGACTSCNPAANRNISDIPGCSCVEGSYDKGVANCGACMATCLTCVNSTQCTACRSGTNRYLLDWYCVCMPGYLENTTLVCPACSTYCENCIGTANNCTSCKSSDHRAMNFSSNTCFCRTGYYEASNETCGQCSRECSSCTSSSYCIACVASYSPVNGTCPRVSSTTLAVFARYQNLNEIAVEAIFNGSIDFTVDSALASFTVKNSEQLDNFTVVRIIRLPNSTSVLIKFNRTIAISTTISLQSTTLRDSDGGLVLNQQQTIDLGNSYYYDGMEQYFLATVYSILQMLSLVMGYSRWAFLLPILIVTGFDLGEFLQLLGYYLFLDISMPGNLRWTLEGLFVPQQDLINPIFKSPVSSCDCLSRPLLYYFYGRDTSFLAGNFFGLCVLIISLVYYCLVEAIAKRSTSNCFLVQLAKKNFELGMYTNSAFISLYCRLPILFGSCASLFFDRSFNSRQKVYNAASSWTFLFVTGIATVVHPLLLRHQKKDRVDLKECYHGALKHHSFSEQYVLSRILVCSATVISIPVFPPFWSLLLVLAAYLYQIRCIWGCVFSSKWGKAHRLASAGTRCCAQFLLFLFLNDSISQNTIATNAIGYAIIGCLLFSISITLIALVVDIVVSTWRFVRTTACQQSRCLPEVAQLEVSNNISLGLPKSEATEKVVIKQKHLEALQIRDLTNHNVVEMDSKVSAHPLRRRLKQLKARKAGAAKLRKDQASN